MPRNGSGTFNPDTILTPNTTAKASDVNAIGDDLGNEITNSVAADGQTTMTGPLKAINGSAAAPAYTFGSDTNTGFFRPAPDQINVALGGVDQGPILNPTSFFSAVPSTGTADYVVGNTSPAGFTLIAGRRVAWLVGDTNTTVDNTLNVEGSGELPQVKRSPAGNVPLAIGDLVSGELAVSTSDGTNWVLEENISQGFSPQVSIASAASTDLGKLNSHNAIITGTTTITGFGSSAHVSAPLYLIKFSGVLTMTNSAALALVGGADIVTAAGDYAWAMYLGSGNWSLFQYIRASGKALIETNQIPSQTGKARNVLTTDGTTAAWSGAMAISAAASVTSGGSLTAGYNIASVSSGGGNFYNITFTAPMNNTNFQVVAMVANGVLVGVAREDPSGRSVNGCTIITSLTNGVNQQFAFSLIVVGGL